VSCNRPLKAFRDRGGVGVRLGWDPGTGDALELPCGKCLGCRMARARAWSVRIMHEAQLWERNRFLTLTYDDEHLPAGMSLRYRDWQLFAKRLRRRTEGRGPLRFFMCGEYGGQTGRPHYHAVIFNFFAPDEVALVNGSSRSDWLEDLWTNGAIHIGDLSPERAAYVAGYTLKKQGRSPVLVDRNTGEYWERTPEFVQMSRRPGLGSGWFARYAGDLFPTDKAVVAGKVHGVPRYYWEKYRATASEDQVEKITEARFERAKVGALQGENSPERRAVREEFAERMQETFQTRGL